MGIGGDWGGPSGAQRVSQGSRMGWIMRSGCKLQISDPDISGSGVLRWSWEGPEHPSGHPNHLISPYLHIWDNSISILYYRYPHMLIMVIGVIWGDPDGPRDDPTRPYQLPRGPGV